jgi:hypothetical protein
MSTSIIAKSKVAPRIQSRTIEAESEKESEEIMIFCPACKAFETVWFNKGELTQNRKFTQFGSHVYHDCGVNILCRLYMTT